MTPDRSEMRLDPLTQTWTVFSSKRRTRPSLPGAFDEEPGESPFRLGNEQFAPHSLYQAKSPEQSQEAWDVRVVPNHAPIFGVEGEVGRFGDGFYDRMDGLGAHEVIVEGPSGEPLESMELPALAEVIKAWKVRMLDLTRDFRLRQMLIVKNVGAAAGAIVPHSVSQLIAFSLIPGLMRRKLDSARAFYDLKKRSIFSEILAEEVRVGTRLVYENNGFAVFCPYAARAPFELAIYPKRQCADFHGITDQELAQIADALRTALVKLGRALNHPSYNLMLFTSPVRTKRSDHWTSIEEDFRWHIEILPRLNPVGGFEMATGFHLNGVWPEESASYYRKIDLKS